MNTLWMMNRPRIILLPGLGADYRLLDAQRSLEADVEVPPWITPRPRETLASYAKRLAGTIDTSRPFYLGGVSFGGMLAAEMVHHLRPHVRGLILLATCQSNRGVPLPYRLAHNVARFVPAAMLKQGHLLMPAVRKMFGIANAEEAGIFSQMLRDTDPAFLKWSLGAVMNWPGPTEPIDVPVIHIHGSCDRILPGRLGEPDATIEGAGHIMNVSHATEVNKMIADFVTQHGMHL
jgi:pimeloyl-ACP methyl ester carboxylesterase